MDKPFDIFIYDDSGLLNFGYKRYSSYVLPVVGDIFSRESFEGIDISTVVVNRVLHPKSGMELAININIAPRHQSDKDRLLKERKERWEREEKEKREAAATH